MLMLDAAAAIACRYAAAPLLFDAAVSRVSHLPRARCYDVR